MYDGPGWGYYHSSVLRFLSCLCVPDLTLADFSGEFSYWNFSMRVKQRLDSQTRAGTQVSAVHPARLLSPDDVTEARPNRRILAGAAIASGS